MPHPVVLTGTVVGPRPGDADSTEEDKLYIVRIEDQRFYRATSLEPEPPEEMVCFGPEWNAEMRRWITAGQRWLNKPGDMSAMQEFSESGRKVGIVVPLKKS